LYIGIDVGGTYTDAVLIEKGAVLKKKKFPTDHDNLVNSLLGTLDDLVTGLAPGELERVVLSTTLITNLIAEKKYRPVGLMLIPGPGINPEAYDFGTETRVLSGAVDYRGREIVPIDVKQVNDTLTEFAGKGYQNIAVVGKFSCRNNAHERQICEIAARYPEMNVEAGYRVSGQLNFPRRAATTLLTAATKREYCLFIKQVTEAMAKREITAPVYILKADGGTLPISASADMPVETIYSGPAASTLGALALSPAGQTSVVVDIGGTTSDLALILSGEPLLASKGARIGEYLTHISSFAVRSVPVGGDSAVTVRDGKIALLAERQGPAYALGGPAATPTDAMRVLGLTEIGDPALAREAMGRIGRQVNLESEAAAREILATASLSIIKSIEQMFMTWEMEPAYRIWEVLQQHKVRPQNIVGVGGAAAGIIPEVAAAMECRAIIPEHAEVANALGAAVAQPTLRITLRADTERGTYTVLEDGEQGTVPNGRVFREEEAIALAKKKLFERAEALQVKDFTNKVEVVYSEVFNVIRGFGTAGRIFDVCVQTPRSILHGFPLEVTTGE
jgi:N-methylhydantoinase A/oxoprolinase/acetone carboxylase beta subunit